MRVLVTGASGNLGTALLRALDGKGHDVRAVARRPPSGREMRRAEWTSLDLADARCLPELQALVDGADAAVNLAWAFHPMRRADYLRTATVGILERVARTVLATAATRLVHVSSVAAYSPRRSADRIDEDWATDGIEGATYSRLKVEAEASLRYAAESAGARTRVTVVRPCLVGQFLAGGPMLRCGLPAMVPSSLLQRSPAMPVDDRFGIQLVHADDVADLLVRVVEQRASGTFNAAAEPVIRGRDIADALGAKPFHLRQELSRAAVDAIWRAHLQPLDPGWVDMALQAPWVDTGRARERLGWAPEHDAYAVLHELARGMAAGAGTGTGALRARRVADGVRRALTQGSVARRRLT